MNGTDLLGPFLAVLTLGLTLGYLLARWVLRAEARAWQRDVRRLPLRSQATMALRSYGFSYNQIAAELGETRQDVGTRIAQTREELRHVNA